MARCTRASCGRGDGFRVAADVTEIRRKGKGAGEAIVLCIGEYNQCNPTRGDAAHTLDPAVPSRYVGGFVPT